MNYSVYNKTYGQDVELIVNELIVICYWFFQSRDLF